MKDWYHSGLVPICHSRVFMIAILSSFTDAFRCIAQVGYWSVFSGGLSVYEESMFPSSSLCCSGNYQQVSSSQTIPFLIEHYPDTLECIQKGMISQVGWGVSSPWDYWY